MASVTRLRIDDMGRVAEEIHLNLGMDYGAIERRLMNAFGIPAHIAGQAIGQAIAGREEARPDGGYRAYARGKDWICGKCDGCMEPDGLLAGLTCDACGLWVRFMDVEAAEQEQGTYAAVTMRSLDYSPRLARVVSDDDMGVPDVPGL